MESADLNSSSLEDRRLHALLQQAVPTIADDGFSQRVLTALPLPPHRARLRVATARLAWCVAGAAAGLVFAWQQGVDAHALAAAADRVSSSIGQLGTALVNTPSGIADSWLSISIGVTMASLLIAFLPDIVRRLRLR